MVRISRTITSALRGGLLFASCGLIGGRRSYQSAEEASAAEDWERASRLWYDIHVSEDVKTERAIGRLEPGTA
ncbi:MAG: hypothetical protein H8E31_05045 [Planctomycetes bacterium]|nr:hypothetical protein [Planctomycetota bacterium]